MPAPNFLLSGENISQSLKSPDPSESVPWNDSGRLIDSESLSKAPNTSNGIQQHLFSDRRSSASSSDSEIPLLPDSSDELALGASDYRDCLHNAGKRPGGLSRACWQYLKDVFPVQRQSQSTRERSVEVDANNSKPLLNEATGKPYVYNWIRSNKYTPLTFLPRQLVAQFSKLANFYLLCFAVLQLIPGLSTIGNYTNIIPLMVFVSISMAKEGYDDYRRHRLDRQENEREIWMLNSMRPLFAGALDWQRTQWRYLTVGNIIKLRRDDPVPADIVLLSSTSPGDSTIAYVETTALDGETNLKRKLAVKSVNDACATPEKLVTCSIRFTAEGPNANLSKFRGRVVVDNQTLPLTSDNIIYRGSVIRNTPELIALILYSGEECKIRMNVNGGENARIKAPRLQFVLNKIILFVVCIVIGLSVYNTIAYQGWKLNIESKLFYLSSADVPFHQELFGFFIMFATMVPLSLFVSMEMIKLAQIYFLNSDVEMYDNRSDTPFEARTSTINEELGQVTHVFSDKTGTLTDNEMKFRRLYVAGTTWSHHDSDGPNSAAMQPWSSISARRSSNRPVRYRTTMDLLDHLSDAPKSAFAHQVRLMLICMALCHTCVPETRPDGTGTSYQASSPDELALVTAAQEMGFVMQNRNQRSITLVLPSPTMKAIQQETYEVLNVIEFSNRRKRMSIIVRVPDGRICVICKGADSVIVERLARTDQAHREHQEQVNMHEFDPRISNRALESQIPRDQSFSTEPGVSTYHETSTSESRSVVEDAMQCVNSFASESLRTLIYAYRFLDDKEYTEWSKIWKGAAQTSDPNYEEMLESAAELIEVNLTLAGVTAIEDKLQQGVPDTISRLRRANIKIWMLTGDKRETAINIGHACGLVQEDSMICFLDDQNDLATLQQKLEAKRLALTTAAHSVFVVDGHDLATISNAASGSLEKTFFETLMLADSVICCRAQPSQKARLVSSIRKRVPNSVTLAVGDGANDIAMIQQAHIGIGITGREGLQAARSSDYSIAQFRFLQKLLLVHGRWNYIRTCKYVLGTLWKEVLFFLTQALFQRWNGYTGTSLYEPWSLSAFNTLFTSLPVMTIGIFEKDLPAAMLLAVPELYQSMGPRNAGMNIWVYFGWTAMAVVESMIVYFCMLWLFAKDDTTKDVTLYSMGDLDFVAVIIVVSMKMQIIEMHDKSIAAFISIFLSVGAAFAWNILIALIYPLMTPYKARGDFFYGFGRNSTWWMTLVVVVICVYGFEFSVIAIRKALFPTDADVFQELEHDRAHNARLTQLTSTSSRKAFTNYSDVEPGAENPEDIPLQDLDSG